jgi:peptide/nickel transport system substrate-binding protein
MLTTRGESVRRRRHLLAAALVVALVAAACGDDDDGGTGGGDGGGDGGGGTITIALGSEPTSLDPHAVDDGGERAVNDNIYETLLTRTPEGELQPGLATDLPEQVDDTTWQFTLREGVTFHNGEEFNADSVVATVERVRRLIDNEATDQSGFFGSITGAEAVDELTVNITTDGPDGVLPARMYWMKMVPASVADQDDLSAQPIGTGPYRFVEFVRGDHITIEANSDYWDGAPDISAVEYRFIEEPGTRLAGLLSGEYDLITNLSPEDVSRAPNSATVQGQEHPVIILDVDDGITSDENVRKALNLAVDKQEIVDQLFGGYAEVDAGQLLSPSILGYNEDLEPYPYDPEEAQSLLEAAGVSGQTITLVGTSGRWLKDRELVEAIAGYWEAVGLRVDLKIMEFGAYLDELFNREARADAIYVSSSNDILDADRQLSTYYQAGGIGSSNSNEELSDLITQARQATDQDERADLYKQALQIAYDGAYFVWLVNNEDIYGMSEDLSWQPRVDAKLLVKEMSVG